MKFLRIAMYATEIISEEYEEYQRQRFTTKFRNIDVQFLPGNCLINWLGATKEGVQKSEKERGKQKSKDLEQEAQRAEQTNIVSAVFSEAIFDSSMDHKLKKATFKSQISIVEKVVQHVIEYKSSPGQVLDSIIEEIKRNKDQVLKDNVVNTQLIEVGIRNYSSQSTLLSNVNISQGASTGLGR